MDSRRVNLILIFSLLAVSAAVVSAVGRGPRLGAYSPIEKLDDPQVVEIAKFAVNEHNKAEGTNLQYVKIVKGEQQVVAGMNYRLVIAAKGGAGVKNYEAVVYDVVWTHSRTLTSFKPL